MTCTIARRARWLACAVVVLACAAWAAPASAIMVKLHNGHYANYDAMGGSKTPQAARNFDAAFTNLDYSGGPIMPSSRNYIVEWLPSNYGSHTPFQTAGSYPLDYLGGVQQFFTDMAADTGLSTNSDAVATQYNDTTGAHSAYNFTYAGTLVDTDPLPANGCPANTGDICITDSQIQAELDSFLSAHSLAADLTHEYFLTTPPDVASCFDSTGSQGCSGNADLNQAYCAYHSRSAMGYVYSNIPDLAGLNGCDPFVTFCPDLVCDYNNGPGDGVLSAISHEHNESITDPEPNNAWTDWGSSVGGENGDKCNNDGLSDPNVNLQFDGWWTDTPYNEVIGGDHYLIQREWSNQTKSCLDSFTANGTTASASFTQAPAGGNAVTFNASASTSTPGNVAEYVWQFNDGPGGSQNSTVESSSPTISHTFPSAGSYTVALTVMNTDGTSNGTANTVIAGGSTGTAPTARFTDSAPALEGTSVSFDGTSSTDPNAGGHLSYAWNFGDGFTATTAAPAHTYATHGTYTVALTVTDSATGLTGSVSHAVTITDEAPTAAFTFSPSAPAAGTSVSFNGNGSSDADGHVSAWSWTFGDGGTATGATPSHTYATAGTYTVSLSITDSDGQHASVSHTVTVSPGSTGTAPTARFTDSAPAVEGTPVSFDGTGSTDPNSGGHLTYAWDFGDGGSATSAAPTHTYALHGSYTVTLTVTDSATGLTGSVSHSVTIMPPSYGRPSAVFSVPAGAEGAALLFNGSGSTDPNAGGTLSYAWAFGDGGTATGAAVSHAFQAGTWNVTLTVTDSLSGLSGSISHLVVVSDERPTVGFSAPAGRAGQPLGFAGAGSDPDGSIVAWSWNFGDGATASGATPTHTYARAGTYNVTLTVVDSSGETASVAHTISIAPRPVVCLVPKLKGKTLADARKALSGAHCALGKAPTPKKPKHSAGRGKHWGLVVAKQSPAPGTTHPSGTKVALTLIYRAIRN